MKKIISLILITLPFLSFSQIGLKAGVNFANVSNAASINTSNHTGFMIGAFLAPTSRGIISSRTEIIFSKQGYNYASSKAGEVNLNYIMLPQLMGINITKYLQLQLGAQMAYLINAKVDSSNGSSGGSKILDLYNRFDYGYALGIEVHPMKQMLIGVRYNVSLGKVYKSIQSGQNPSFTSQDAKNNVVQLFAGWRFGK